MRGALPASLLLIAVAAAPLHADLVSSSSATVGQPQSGAVLPLSQFRTVDVAVTYGVDRLLLWPHEIPVAEPGTLSSSGQESLPDRDMAIRQMPPGPDSTVLFLSALGSFGVWQIGRSARKLHFSLAPAWYHTGAPGQIGHAVVLDLSFQVLPACQYEQAVSEPSTMPFVFAGWYEIEVAFNHQIALSPSAPRAPPHA